MRAATYQPQPRQPVCVSLPLAGIAGRVGSVSSYFFSEPAGYTAMAARPPNAPPPGSPPSPAVVSSSEFRPPCGELEVSEFGYNNFCRSLVECRTVFRFNKRLLELELIVQIFHLVEL
jgi:hypothetical protein